jgi:branched-chain amino acid transport system substrate-binding protein
MFKHDWVRSGRRPGLRVGSLAGFACILGLVLLAGCGGGGSSTSSSSGGSSSSNSGGSTTEKVGLIYSSTGPLEPYGVSLKNGTTLAVEQINAKGGVDVGGSKVKLELAAEDDQGEPTKGVTALRDLTDQSIGLVLGVISSDVVAAIEPLMADESTTLISGGTVYDEGEIFTRGNAARIPSPIPALDAAQVGLLKGKVKKVAVLTDSEHAGLMAARSQFKKDVEEAGMEVVFEDEYPEATQTDFTSSLTRIKSLGAEGIFVRGVFSGPLYVASQAKKLGMNEVLVAGDISTSVSETEKLVKPSEIEGLQTVANASTEDLVALGTKGLKAFDEEYVEHFGSSAPNLFAAQGHDQAMLLAAAMAKAGSTEPTAVAKAMWELTPSDLAEYPTLLPLGTFPGGEVLNQEFGGADAPFSQVEWTATGPKVVGLVYGAPGATN